VGPLGVNVQLQTLGMADVPDLRRFAGGGALLICDWEAHLPETLAVLDAAGVPVGMWRWTEDPRGWQGWPAGYIARCPRALFANEPDLEGWPAWYDQAWPQWTAAGGILVEPAYHDDRARVVLSPGYHATSAHCYAGDFANLGLVRSRAAGMPVFLTEYGREGQQRRCLTDLAAGGVTEDTYLYTYRARDAQAQPAYNLAGVALLPAPAPVADYSGIIPPPIPPAVPVATQGVPMAPTLIGMTAYVTQMDPQGSGEERCGPAACASAQCSLIPGTYDRYQLMRLWTAKVNEIRAARGASSVFVGGSTSQDLVEAAPSFGLKGRLWTPWADAEAAWAGGEVVLALVRNALLSPRLYPDAPGWTETADGTPIQHWERIEPLVYGGARDGVYLLLFDSLCYLPQRGAPFQGMACVHKASVSEAIGATDTAEAGVIFSKA
jgi:hypothetical protein